MLSTSLRWLAFLVLAASSLAAQVRIIIPKQRYQPEEQIQATLQNRGSRPITVCVQIGQWSPKGDTLESTPSPFVVERDDNGNWNVLLNGPDIGSNSQPVEVKSGDSQEFPFRLNDRGTMRLRLDYWLGSKPDVKCNDSRNGTKRLHSATFKIG